MDILNSLPQPIIETILCLLPIKDAVRTSIFSRKWRYNWTKIPKLDFWECSFETSANVNKLYVMEQTFDVPSQRKNMTKRCKLFNAIYQVLLLHQGPIHEFSLDMYGDGSCVELDHIILHLSRNHTLKKLTLALSYAYEYRLPLSIFSLRLLTDLYLQGCNLEHQPTFTGFVNLTSLTLDDVIIEKETLLHLLTNCPLLKRLRLLIDDKSLLGDDECTVIELFDCLPMIEHLTTCHWVIQSFGQDGFPRVHTSTLVHLKNFSLTGFCYPLSVL